MEPAIIALIVLSCVVGGLIFLGCCVFKMLAESFGRIQIG
jgi:hypothetical protein